MLPQHDPDPAPRPWPREAISRLNDHFECGSPRALLAWGYDTFGSGMVMGTGFGPSGVLLAYFVAQVRADVTLFYLDTDLLFPETLALRDALSERLGLTFVEVKSEVTLAAQEAAHGPALWRRDPDRCCHLRKVQPLHRFLGSRQAWVTGLRRDQSPTRRATDLIEWDASHGVVKLNPLAHWTREDVWCHLRLHDLPYNRLHDAGYPSVGCRPCTRPVAEGTDERAGRWQGLAKTECGIHRR